MVDPSPLGDKLNITVDLTFHALTCAGTFSVCGGGWVCVTVWVGGFECVRRCGLLVTVGDGRPPADRRTPYESYTTPTTTTPTGCEQTCTWTRWTWRGTTR